ncbi:cytochrome c6, chloroplastic isoform X2 [Magnolia sinica]|uniref:cytochrome c6, chloroplastic isoform X2 n=1 Tax=Magnolia sinica TaxID=86752 RepID=UPI00265913A8|nr:cytochrome c6, chloroplastic isoform X2 [Magnolia sinica]
MQSLREESPHSQVHSKRRYLQCLAPPLLAAFISLSPLSYPPVSHAQPIDGQRGAALFNKACIGCHDGGGNILQPGATLFMKDLQRNGVDTEEGIYGITYYGKGRMPGFGENCTPKGQCTFGARLQDEEIKLLAEFVKSQAARGWPSVESYGD